jgi:colanic acid biosynthesis glycosyl transferase WcaI
MRILLLCNSFGKGYAATAHLAAELGESLVEHGYEVVVWTRGSTRNHAVSTCSRSILVLGTDGSWVLQTKNRFISELLLLVRFCCRAYYTNIRYDHVICMDSPRLALLAAWILRLRTGSRTLAWVMDLAWEQLNRQGTTISSRCIAALFMRVQVMLLEKTDHVVTLGRCMASTLHARGVSRHRIKVIGSWAEDSWAKLAIDSTASRSKYGLPERFTIMYSGYAGKWHDFDSISYAMAAMSNDKSIQWVFAGSGPGIDQVRRRSAINLADNLVFLDWVPRDELPQFLSCADVHLVSLKESMLGTCVPSKLYPLMALAKPVVFVGPATCQTAIDLTEAQAGVVATNGSVLVDILRGLIGHPFSIQYMGENARNAFNTKHNVTIAIDQWIELLGLSQTEHN